MPINEPAWHVFGVDVISGILQRSIFALRPKGRVSAIRAYIYCAIPKRSHYPVPDVEEGSEINLEVRVMGVMMTDRVKSFEQPFTRDVRWDNFVSCMARHVDHGVVPKKCEQNEGCRGTNTTSRMRMMPQN